MFPDRLLLTARRDTREGPCFDWETLRSQSFRYCRQDLNSAPAMLVMLTIPSEHH
jgi:hypothetical protein